MERCSCFKIAASRGALDARFKVTVQIDHPQDVLVFLPLDVDVPVKHDLAFRECPRLMTAENINAAEVLNWPPVA